MLLKDIMSTKVESVRPSETLTQASARMRERGIHHLIVVNRGHVVGVVSAADLETRIAEGVARVEDAMARHVTVAEPGMTVAQAARALRGRSSGALPILEGRRLVGIVTISDLLDVLARRPARASVRLATRRRGR
jgi:CBS domain-containing protein